MAKVLVTYYNSPADSREMRSGIKIELDGQTVFDVLDGEPEDANLSRDFGACYSIPDLMQQAWELGKKGEPLEIEFIDTEDLEGF